MESSSFDEGENGEHSDRGLIEITSLFATQDDFLEGN